MPFAARLTDMRVSSNAISMSFTTVMISGKSAVRMGDPTSHRSIVFDCSPVLNGV